MQGPVDCLHCRLAISQRPWRSAGSKPRGPGDVVLGPPRAPTGKGCYLHLSFEETKARPAGGVAAGERPPKDWTPAVSGIAVERENRTGRHCLWPPSPCGSRWSQDLGGLPGTLSATVSRPKMRSVVQQGNSVPSPRGRRGLRDSVQCQRLGISGTFRW